MQRDARQSFAFTLKAQDGRARRGEIATPRGVIRTPAFMPVGTAATVKAMLPETVRATGADIILANTYHLMLRPGAERIAKLGGLARLLGWGGARPSHQARRAAPLHGLGRAHPYRLGRLPGDVAFQAPPHRGARRDLPVAYRRRHASAHARPCHRGAMP